MRRSPPPVLPVPASPSSSSTPPRSGRLPRPSVVDAQHRSAMTRQDRPDRCRRHRSLRRGHEAGDPAAARRGNPPSIGTCRTPTPDRRDDRRREAARKARRAQNHAQEHRSHRRRTPKGAREDGRRHRHRRARLARLARKGGPARLRARRRPHHQSHAHRRDARARRRRSPASHPIRASPAPGAARASSVEVAHGCELPSTWAPWSPSVGTRH